MLTNFMVKIILRRIMVDEQTCLHCVRARCERAEHEFTTSMQIDGILDCV